MDLTEEKYKLILALVETDLITIKEAINIIEGYKDFKDVKIHFDMKTIEMDLP